MYNVDMTNVNEPVDLTISMLEILFRGHDLSDNQGFVLPDGEYLTNSDLRLLFESYTQ
jgi:hypothetical protein